MEQEARYMRSNHPRHVEIRLAVPADAAARREALEALLAGRGDLPFLRWRESPDRKSVV